jgi:beta-lactamase class A
MAMKQDRRTVLGAAGTLALSACVPLDRTVPGRLAAKLRLIEQGLGGELGVAFLDTERRLELGYRQHERFALCSTFKTSLAALVLELVAEGELDGNALVRWRESDLQSHAPFTHERLASGATLLELARAAQVTSDNTAANLLLARVGGPSAVTAFWRALGDPVSRLDRTEPQLNFVPAGTVLDTTTPAAMAQTLYKLIAAGPLDDGRRGLLRRWMRETTTGLKRVRAGIPDEWESGDKTGSSGNWPGMGYTRADIGYVVAPAGGIVTFAAYHRAPQVSPPTAETVDEAFAELGRTLTAWVRENYAIVLT